MSKKTNSIIIKTVVIVVLLVSLVAYTYRSFVPNLIPIVSNIDGKEYMVQNYPDKQVASDNLSKMCARLNQFINILYNEYPDDKRVQRLKNNFKCSKIKEGNGSMGQTSYTVEKGKSMVLCMRDKNKNLHQANVLTFVTIHELSHIASESYGHNGEFRDNFKWLIEEAEARNFYTHDSFDVDPENYCGIQIDAVPH